MNTLNHTSSIYDCIVIGAGHAGCEAALACARLNKKTLLVANNLDTIAFLACNPSIGGTAKGQIVKEIDALGGQMAINADSCLLQLRMLNKGKGAAVYSPRAQVDKHKYHANMKLTLENTQHLTLRQAQATSLTYDKDTKLFTMTTQLKQTYLAAAVILATGVYLNSRIVVGDSYNNCGPNGFESCKQLTNSLIELGFNVRRFKTGTPARINKRSIDFDKMIEQPGENMPKFSYMSDDEYVSLLSCYLTYSTAKTKETILSNKSLAPLYNGQIVGIGPRYCPSIEDKVVRFADKPTHQVFLEPEGLNTNEYYVQGVSTSMPYFVQQQIYSSIAGLENVEIMRDSYAIEYDCIDSTDLYPTLMYKKIDGLFTAGQINGTSGYEEAAAQGLIAGINAVRFIEGKKQIVLPRDSSYIGVLIDDITTKGTNEPYRMMTSRAEYRLYIRQDNADLRLTPLGREIGLVDDTRYDRYLQKVKLLDQLRKEISSTVFTPSQVWQLFADKGETQPYTGITIKEMLKRTNIEIGDIVKYLDALKQYSLSILEEIEVETKYEGYIAIELRHIIEAKKLEEKVLPTDVDYLQIKGLRIEAREKLNKIKPLNVGQASRISGVSPADVQVLLMYLLGKGK